MMELANIESKLSGLSEEEKATVQEVLDLLLALPEENRKSIYMRIYDEDAKVKRDARGWCY